MADDIASLVIKVNSLEAEVAKHRLNGLAGAGGRAEKATNGLMGTFLKFAVPLAAVAGSMAAIKKAASVEREFGILNAGLITATGSADKAAIAFEAIERFAANTPYDLQQATAGFTKLVNMGLDPSMRAMTSYGDTSAAMGKNLNDMVEAVADAATGEFERLKEFGIRASSQGDQVSFTFRGVTKTVAKEAGAIEDYLIGLGETNFAGGMSRRMDELDGKMSNMGDSWDGLWRTINDKGLGDLMVSSVDSAIGSLDSLNNAIESGFLEEVWNAQIGMLDQFTQDWDNGMLYLEESSGGALSTVSELFSGLSEDALHYGELAVDNLIKFWKYFPINVRWFIQRAIVEYSVLVDYAKEVGSATIGIFKTAFSSILDSGRIYFDAIAAVMTFQDYDLVGELAKMNDMYTELYSGIWQTAKTNIAAIREERLSEIQAIDDVRDADIDAYESRIAKAIELRDAVSGEESAGDTLGQFRVIPDEVKEEEIGFWERYLEAADNSLTSLDELATNVIDRFSAGAGDAFAQWVTGAKSGDEAMNDFLKSMVTGTISALGQMAAQWLAYQAVQMLVGKTTATGAAVALSAEAQAASLMAGIHAFSSTAAIPVIGPPAAPGAMGAALAVTQPMAAAVGALSAGMVAGAYDEGGHIPAGKVGIVGEHGIELARGPMNITGREETLNMIKGMKGQSSRVNQEVVNINLNVTAIDSVSFDDYLVNSSDTLVALMREYKESEGRTF